MSQCNNSVTPSQVEPGVEVVKIPKTTTYCGLCDDYARRQADKPIAVLCCEGGCLRGEVARQASNYLCHQLLPQQTVRICLGGAFTKDSGQRELVRQAARVVALEGCVVDCGSRMMAGVVEVPIEVIHVDELYHFDRRLFGIDELPEDQLKQHGIEAANTIATRLQGR